MADESKNEGKAAAYVTWSTFKNALDEFAETVPNQVDRTVYPGLAGGVQSQLLAGLKFLGLIDEKGKPTETLRSIDGTDEAQRKMILANILKQRYADAFALDLSKATPAQLNDTMAKSYNVTGETREKAVRFFLSAAEYVGTPLSSYLKPRNGTGGGASSGSRRRRPAARPRPSTFEPDGDEGLDDGPPSGNSAASRRITLATGGTLTLSASTDFFALSQEDRNFVFEIIDKMNSYEKAIAAKAAEPAE